MRVRTQMRRSLVLVSLLKFAAACGASSISDLAIINGHETDRLEEVILLQSEDGASICTGTFVSDTTVITAAHCVVSETVFHKGIGPVSTIVHDAYQADPKKIDPADVAILVFPSGMAAASTRLAAESAKVDDEIVIAGYGASDAVGSRGARVKRFGRNVIKEASEQLLRFEGSLGPNGAATSSQGDSGGPLFLDGSLAGVTTGGKINVRSWTKQSFYANLMSSSNQEFLCTASARGAQVQGLRC